MARAPRSKESKAGISWFFKEIKKAATDFKYNAFNPTKDPFIGGLFFFLYDPKYKETLPYWDKFPLVIPFGVEADSFIGLNLHYLPINDRKKLLDFLLKQKTKKSNRQYMSISYSLLKAAAQTDHYKPCVKRYLKSHLRSRLVKVDQAEWENVAVLPVQQFQKRIAVLGEHNVRSKKCFRIFGTLPIRVCKT